MGVVGRVEDEEDNLNEISMKTNRSTEKTTLRRTRSAFGLLATASLLLAISGMASEPDRDRQNDGSVQLIGCHRASTPSTIEVLTGRAEFCALEVDRDRDLSSDVALLNIPPVSRLRLELGGFDVVGRQFVANSAPRENSEKPVGANPVPLSWKWASASWRF